LCLPLPELDLVRRRSRGRLLTALFFGRTGAQPLDARKDGMRHLGAVDALQPLLDNALYALLGLRRHAQLRILHSQEVNQSRHFALGRRHPDCYLSYADPPTGWIVRA
jgi:hypothetical protein